LGATKIVLVGMPTMLRQLVRSVIASPPGLAIEVDELPHDTLASPSLRERDVDLVIIDTAAASDETVEAFLAERCGVRVLGVSSDGRRGLLHEMRPHRVLVGELSRDVLVEIVASSHRSTAPPLGAG
jgi:hypothetical protein